MSRKATPPHANPELLGHAQAEAMLLGAWRSGRMPHGWLFTGRTGAGKATLAFRFARFLLSGGGETLTLPADHPVIGPVAADAHPDLVRVTAKDPKASGKRVRAEIGVEDVRTAIAALQRTAVGAHRVMVVDQAHLLNPNAANALLKTLEEPGRGVVVILTADSVDRFPATIRSRVARLRLLPLATPVITEWLRDRHGVDSETARAATLAEGSPGLALAFVDADALGHYGRLVAALAKAAGERGVADVGAALEAMLKAEDASFARELVGQLLRRAVAQHFGQDVCPLVADEARVLEAQARRLDRLWEVWDKLAVLDAVAERLSLDRQALVVDLAASLVADRTATV